MDDMQHSRRCGDAIPTKATDILAVLILESFYFRALGEEGLGMRATRLPTLLEWGAVDHIRPFYLNPVQNPVTLISPLECMLYS